MQQNNVQFLPGTATHAYTNLCIHTYTCTTPTRTWYAHTHNPSPSHTHAQNQLLPPSDRLPPHTRRKPTGPYDRKHLIDHLKQQAEDSKVGEDYVPFVKKTPSKDTQVGQLCVHELKEMHVNVKRSRTAINIHSAQNQKYSETFWYGAKFLVFSIGLKIRKYFNL